MKLAALITGIIGGILGLLYGFMVPASGPIFYVTLLLSMAGAIAGIIGGALSMAKPKAGGTTLIVSGIVTIMAKSFSSAFLTGLVPGIIMIVGGVLALVAARRTQAINPTSE